MRRPPHRGPDNGRMAGDVPIHTRTTLPAVRSKKPSASMPGAASERGEGFLCSSRASAYECPDGYSVTSAAAASVLTSDSSSAAASIISSRLSAIDRPGLWTDPPARMERLLRLSMMVPGGALYDG